MLKIEKNVISRMPTVCFYTVVSGEINYLLTYLLYVYTLASVALNFTQGPGASCVACIA